MRVLVTGSSGFIGRHLIPWLRKHAHPGQRIEKVLGVSRRSQLYVDDVEYKKRPNPLSWEKFFEEVHCDLTLEGPARDLMLRYRPELVFHLAGDPIIRPDPANPSAVVYSHVLPTQHLLAYAPPQCRFVLASSCAVYGDMPGAHHESNEPTPTSVYGAAKAAGELLLTGHHNLGRVRGLSVRLAATVGMGAGHGLLPDVVRKLLSPSGELELLGAPPGSVKPYTHVWDVVSGLVKFGFGDHDGVVNLANEDAASVLDVAREAMRAIGRQKPVRWLGEGSTWPGDNPEVLVNSAKAKALGWRPAYDTSLGAVARAAVELYHEHEASL